MKKIISLIVVVGLLVAAWLGASFYSARTTGQFITSLPERYQQNDYVHIKTVEHQQSAFSSTGKFEIRFPNFIPVADGAPTALGIVIQYKISNLLLPSSAGRLEWKMTGDDSIDPILKKLFGQGPTMHGKGHISYGGQRQSSIELSELLLKDSQTALKLTPLTGLATWDNDTLKLTLQSDHLNARSEGVVTDWRGMSIDVNLSNRNLGLGTYSFGIEKGTNASSKFEGMKLTKIASLENDRFNLVIAQTIKQFSYDKFKLSDVDQEFALRGLDKDSVMSISTILRDAKDVNRLTAEDRVALSKSLRALFNNGFSIGLPRLVAKLDGGSLSGNLNIEVIKADDTVKAFSSAQRLRAIGQVNLNGKGGLDKTQQMTALMLGLAVKTPEGLKSSFEFTNGVISANGKSFNVQENLKFLDDMINAALNP
ncbi:MAG: YdgA family protein [Burkholderiaceae bacterium]|nr:YdgA family protein [Burkholderiaceae bacterium]